MQEKAPIQEEKEFDPHIARTISDEYLRYRIRKILDEPKPAYRWTRFLTHQLFLLIVGFALTSFVGTRIANNFNAKQAELEYQRNIHLKELESERSFADELNKIKLNKIAEVWEKLYLYEAAVEEVMEQVVEVKGNAALQGKTLLKPEGNAAPQGQFILRLGNNTGKTFEQGKALQKEVLTVLSKNRLWLEDDSYYKIKEYVEVIYNYYFAKKSQEDIKKWEEKREQARDSINQIREKMLKR